MPKIDHRNILPPIQLSKWLQTTVPASQSELLDKHELYDWQLRLYTIWDQKVYAILNPYGEVCKWGKEQDFEEVKAAFRDLKVKLDDAAKKE